MSKRCAKNDPKSLNSLNEKWLSEVSLTYSFTWFYKTSNKSILKSLLAQIYLTEIAIIIVSSVLVIFSVHYVNAIAVLRFLQATHLKQ